MCRFLLLENIPLPHVCLRAVIFTFYSTYKSPGHLVTIEILSYGSGVSLEILHF